MVLLNDFKIVWIYLRKHKKEVVKLSFLAVLFAIVSGIIPYIYGRLVDMVSLNSFNSLVLAFLGIWVLTSAGSALLRRFVALRGGMIGAEALEDLVLEHAKHVINLPLSFHKEKKVGEVVSRITRAADHLKDIIENTLFWIFPQFLTVLIGLLVMAFINWKLFLGILTFFFLSVLITIFRVPKVVEAQKKVSKSFDISAGTLNDSLTNIQTIKGFSAEDFQGEKIKKTYSREVVPSLKNILAIWENTHFFQEITFSLGFVAAFSYALFLLTIGEISNGVLIMFLGYLNLTRMPLMFLLWQWLSIQRGLAGIKRARKFLGLGKEAFNRKGKVLGNVKGEIEYKNVSFKYPRKKLVLDGISFKALSGQKIAIVGGSGGGKTTLADLLSLYFLPTKGKITIDGVNIKSLDLSFLRSMIAYVPQEIVLFNDTIKNNLLYGNPQASMEMINEAAKIANIDHFINGLPQKYNTVVGERGVKLSGGQKQRLAIARAVISNPKILVLDEATSSLDVKSEKLIQKAIDNLIKDKTTFIIAHRLSTTRNADKILVIEKGKIMEEGKHEELMKKKGIYYNFYNLQFAEDF